MSPEGAAYTRDMIAWVRTLDATRPVTFVALGQELSHQTRTLPERSLHYVDFMCINYYGPPAKLGESLDALHALWPEKPVMLSEFGLRFDRVKVESVRVTHLRDILAVLRARPFICGLSFWAFNDYRRMPPLPPRVNIPGASPGDVYSLASASEAHARAIIAGFNLTIS